jgi:hypothetical protein
MARLALLVLLVAACGGGDDGPDTPIDARSIDGPPPDAEPDRCEVLCGCTAEFCSDTMETCLADCASLSESVRECRIEHCGYAQTNPGFHCPHALGDAESPGVPPECIQQ